MKLPPAVGFFVRWTIRLAALTILVGIPAVFLYLYSSGIQGTWKQQLEEVLSGPSFKTQIGRLTLNPFSGLVGENVVITDTTSGTRKIAQVNRVSISLNLNDLTKGKIFVDTLKLESAELSIPLDAGDTTANSPRVELQDVNASVVILPAQLRITYASFIFQGIHFHLVGTLENPREFRMPEQKDPEGGTGNRKLVEGVLRELESLRFSGAQPRVDLSISGSLAELSTLQLDQIRADFKKTRYRQWKLSSVELDAAYVDRKLTIRSLEIWDDVGRLKIYGDLLTQTALLTVDVVGSLNFPAVAASFGAEKIFADFQLQDPVQLELEAQVDFSTLQPIPRATGSLSFGRFSVKDIPFLKANADFALKDRSVFLRNLVVQDETGSAEIDALYTPEAFQAKLLSSLIPSRLAPLFGGVTQLVLEDMEFAERPSVEFYVEGPKPDMNSLIGTGRVALGKTAMRGSWIDRGSADVMFKDLAVHYSNVVVEKGKTQGTGEFVYDFARKEVRIANVKSTMNPPDLLMWVEPNIANAVRPYRFRGPPTIWADGKVDMKTPDGTGMKIKVEAPSGVDYDLLGKTLRFGALNGKIDVKGYRVYADIAQARLYDGTVGLKLDISTRREDPEFGVDITANRVDFASLTKLYFDYDDSKGRMSGRFAFRARPDQPLNLRGQGNIKVQDGRVFSLPVLGPLSLLLNEIIPGAGYQTARLATADFQVGDRKIVTKNMEIEGQGFSLFGEGDINLQTHEMDMAVRINAKGVPGIVLFPVSKLFEYVSEGTVGDPQWRPKRLPKELLGGAIKNGGR